MIKTILDTSFILSCIKNKIDFFEQLEIEGFQILIPKQVIEELEKKKSVLALKILEANKTKFRKIDLKQKNVDKGLIKLGKSKDVIIATLDREIKNKIKYPKIVIRGKKKLEVV